MRDPIAPLKVVAANAMYIDPALDMSHEEIERYRETRDPSMLKLKEGMQPAWFEVQRLKPSQVVALESVTIPGRWFAAFLDACHRVENADGNGLEWKPEAKAYDKLADGRMRAKDGWFDLVASKFGIETCYEIGRIAFEWARLPEGAKGPFT